MSAASEHETVIEPARGWRLVPWRELHEYRDLLWLFVWRDLAARYKQTLLGPLWFVVQPVLTTLVFAIVFGRVAHVGTGGTPPVLFYLSGLLIWSYFSACFNSTSLTLSNNAGLFGKVYFPRLIVPLSAILSNVAAFAVQAAVFAGFFAAYKLTAVASTFHLSWSLLLMPLVLIQVATLSLGVGLWLAALTARFRDFAILTGFVLQLWMYATPVIYPLANVPERWRPLVALNPMSMPVEWTRRMLLGSGTSDWKLGAICAAVTILAALTGLLAFNRAERDFVDVI